MPLHHRGDLLHRGEPRADRPAVPALVPTLAGCAAALLPQGAQGLLARPCPCRLEARRLELGERDPPVDVVPAGRDIAVAVEPQVLRADESIISLRTQRLVLAPSHLIDG